MSKIAYVTDSNSGITQKEAKELGITVIPMPFFINGEIYYEDISLTQQEFYKRLEEDADISTSQPSPADIQGLWDKLLEEYDEIVHIPMSSGLSGSCATALMLSEEYDGKVQVVNNQRISITMKQAVKDALTLGNAGKSAAEIKEVLEAQKFDSSIYISLETLKYLKKGGRITPAAAALGTILNLKPVLQIQGEKLDAYAKARGMKAAKKTMLEAIKKDWTTRFKEYADKNELVLMYSYSGNPEEALQWKQEIEEAFPGINVTGDPLSLSVSCHIGKGALAVACARKVVV